MTDQMIIRQIRSPENAGPVEGDPFFELAQEIDELIARRAYELFEATGCAHGQDRENWLQAQSELLLDVPVEVSETDTELAIHADVPGCSDKDLEVRIAPRSLCISGTRQPPSGLAEGKTVYTERHPTRIFRLLNLPSEIDTEKVSATVADGVLEVKLLKIGLGKQIPVLAKSASA